MVESLMDNPFLSEEYRNRMDKELCEHPDYFRWWAHVNTCHECLTFLKHQRYCVEAFHLFEVCRGER